MTEERGVTKYEARDGQEIKLTFDIIKRYLVQGKKDLVTEQEAMFFMGICKSRGLNPFLKDCYLIKYSSGDAAQIITSIDYFRKRARAQSDCRGWSKGPLVVKEDGELRYSNGIILNGETLIGGWFKAQPAGWDHPFEMEVNLNGYVKKTSDGRITRFWAEENQPAQIAKVAESQGLRTVWPDEFQQLYSDVEMPDAGPVVDITPPPEKGAADPYAPQDAQDDPGEEAAVEPTQEAEPDQESPPDLPEMISQGKIKALNEILGHLGMGAIDVRAYTVDVPGKGGEMVRLAYLKNLTAEKGDWLIDCGRYALAEIAALKAEAEDKPPLSEQLAGRDEPPVTGPDGEETVGAAPSDDPTPWAPSEALLAYLTSMKLDPQMLVTTIQKYFAGEGLEMQDEIEPIVAEAMESAEKFGQFITRLES